MKLPLVLLSDLTEQQNQKWQRQFVNINRTYLEGVWRRSQEKENAKESGWKSDKDARIRLLQFRDSYKLNKISKNSYNLELENGYLWLYTELPLNELENYTNKILETAISYQWHIEESGKTYKITKGEMSLSIRVDIDTLQKKRILGSSSNPVYGNLEVSIITGNPDLKPIDSNAPWNLFNIGIRKKGTRGTSPQVIKNLNQLKKLMPFQLELGAGISINCGISPLHTLHGIYYVSDLLTKKFKFGIEDKLVCDILSNPESFYSQASLILKQAILAEPSELYRLFKKWQDEGKVVGKTITNNFDGLTSVAGLKELYIRKFSEKDLFPKINFSKDAKSLLVVGVHADRRNVQKSARKSGLNIIYLDPECFFDDTGNWFGYPLESIQNSDYLIPHTSDDFMDRFITKTKIK